ncbi:DUF262 domain-containing protein [Leptolinea tardivitalis]|uniref:GmrSD restriction endonucleases N-terminal domain-containing protein n=1 Tax=Leptolinea tardivitalis TaxID=229920 RepID=A0A0N8GLH1_9CHLR|nr:DUF262 domain-containing protein [Leptolinea tardivitalis]KPL72482.1 hypothetical protein ADM99_04925 [Leptolinea tardivitalis]GAP21236.1 uncharacterized conserved protein [Leptolinea tardivitalis]
MNIQKTFTSPDLPLEDILNKVEEGKTQIPEFQRGWVWDDDRIKSLLASISLSYPIGALMMLKDGQSKSRFKTRLVEGVELTTIPLPEMLILDGQQRLTSLYQALKSNKPADTRDNRGKSIKRWYYIDIEKALNPNFDREEAIISLPEEKLLRNFRGEVIADYSTPEKEYETQLFPFREIFSSSNWRAGFNKFNKYNSEKVELFDKFEQEIIKRFEQYQVTVIQLEAETPKEAVCQVFEKVNTGGVALTVFELLTATFAADDYSLRDDWLAREKCFKKNKILSKLGNTDFLQALTLLATRARREQQLKDGVSLDDATAISCKRKDILNLTLEEYSKWADSLTTGFELSARFIHTQKIFSHRDLPYTTQLTPLAAIMTILHDKADNDGVRSLLAQWYWCGVLGELYGSSVETRFAKDLLEVLDWINAGTIPTTVSEASFNPARLWTLRTRNSAAYKGIQALLIRTGAQDFRTGISIDDQSYFDEAIDIHHIFPQDWCIKQNIPASRYNSIINKTPISAKTNRMIGGNAPSVYLCKMEKSAGIDNIRMDSIIRSHVIEPKLLRENDMNAMWQAREKALLSLIESAMGKSVLRSWSDSEEIFAESEEADDEL